MMKIKGLSYLPVLAALLFLLPLHSCSYKAEYITSDTPIYFSLVEKGCAYLTVGVDPLSDKVYYSTFLMEKDEYDALGLSQKEVMDYVLDSLKRRYEAMRALLDPTGTETYYCSFADFALSYASSEHKFTGLMPGVDYIFVAFCVNPETNTPMGDLHTVTYSTIDWGDIKESTMDFEFRIWDDDDEDSPELRCYIKPMQGDTVSRDYYIFGDAVPVDTLAKESYGGSLVAYAEHYVSEYTGLGALDAVIVQDIHETAYLNLPDFPLFEDGKEYILWAMPYSVDAYSKIRYHRFTYYDGLKESGYVKGLLWKE